MSTKLYVENVDLYKEKLNQKFLEDSEPSFSIFEESMLLPPIKVSNKGTRGTYAGGVADRNGKFISGLKRADKTVTYDCNESYIVDKKDLFRVDEDVIFGGIVMPAFGNAMIESLSRLWYIVENPNDTRRVAILFFSEIKQYHLDFFRLAGVDEKRLLIIDKPTIFKSILVPDETVKIWSSYNNKYNVVYDHIRKNIKPKKFKKIYFTRTQLKERYDVNEEFFEEFYKKRGYKIIAPEKLSLEEQISYAAGADELVCAIGTLSHFVLFMNYGSRLTILNRTKDKLLTPQFIINSARNTECTFIDSIIEVLPISHNWGCACMYPTEYFKQYLIDESFKFTDKELKLDEAKIVYEFLRNYALNYKNPLFFKMIQSYDMYDVIKSLNKHFFNEDLLVSDVYKKGSEDHLKTYWIKKCNEQEKIINDINKGIVSNNKSSLKSKRNVIRDFFRRK